LNKLTRIWFDLADLNMRTLMSGMSRKRRRRVMVL